MQLYKIPMGVQGNIILTPRRRKTLSTQPVPIITEYNALDGENPNKLLVLRFI